MLPKIHNTKVSLINDGRSHGVSEILVHGCRNWKHIPHSANAAQHKRPIILARYGRSSLQTIYVYLPHTLGAKPMPLC